MVYPFNLEKKKMVRRVGELQQGMREEREMGCECEVKLSQVSPLSLS